MATTVDLEADQGATYIKRFIWRNNLATPQEIDLSGYTARMHIRESVDADTIDLELTTENGRILLGGVAGTIDLNVDAADMAALEAGSYKYDLELVSGGGVVTRLIQGKFKVIAEVTR